VNEWRDLIKDEFVQVETGNMAYVAKAHASLLQAVFKMANRDLYILARLAGWLTFGGVARSGSFTAMEQAAEGCKNGLNESACVLTGKQYVPLCPCLARSWSEENEQCISASLRNFDDRQRQRRFYAGQVRDADRIYGRRDAAISFPEFDFSPETTLWWNDTSVLPGSGNGQDASGFLTTYDRVRVLSGLAAVEIPVYNYAMGLGRPSLDVTTFVAFDSDGLMTGFSGCEHFEAAVPFFESTKANGAAAISSDLCPEGKFGYDPRCQKWYHGAKTRNEATYVSPPFRLDWSTHPRDALVLLSQPIMDAASGVYVGQVAMHVKLQVLLSSISDATIFVVSVESDINGGDTVAGPAPNGTWNSIPIADALFSNSEDEGRFKFTSEILPAMKSGAGPGLKNISWSDKKGSEVLSVAFAPLRLSSWTAVNSSNFSRGTVDHDQLVYSVGIARLESETLKPYVAREKSSEEKLDRQAGTLAWVATALVLGYVIFICYVSS
jgi:hypothetical protein